MKRMSALLVPWIAAVLLPGAGWAITEGQIDDFQDGTTMGWKDGVNSPNQPTNEANGGPQGAGDRFLRNASDGSAGAGGKMVQFNNTTWTGDWNAANVAGVRMYLNNLGTNAMDIRIALLSGSTWFVSQTPFALPPASGWQHADFDTGDMTRVSGTLDLAAVLGDVDAFRILHSSTVDFSGDAIAAVLGVDNVTALAEVPVEETTWGAIKIRPLLF